MRARMALIIAGIDYEHREIILRDKPASMLKASPKGTVPILILGGPQTLDELLDKILDESLDIMLWALAQSDPENWLEGDLPAMTSLIEQTQSDFKPHLDRYKYASRYDSAIKRGELDMSARAKAEKFIAKLEERLSQNAYLFAASPRLADYAIFTFIRQFANTDRTWWDSANYPKTQAWLGGLLASDLFKNCMKKYDLWSEI